MSATRQQAVVLALAAVSVAGACSGPNVEPTAVAGTDPAVATTAVISESEPSAPTSSTLTTTPATVDASTSTPSPTTEAAMPEPRPMKPNTWMVGGYTYESQQFAVPLQLTAPDTDEGRWKLWADLGTQMLITVNPAVETVGVPSEEPPVLAILASSDVPAESMIAALLEWSETTDGVELVSGEGDFLGQNVPTVAGTVTQEGNGLPFYGMPVGDDLGLPTSYGERRVEAYFVPIGEHVVAVKLGAHPLEWEHFLQLAAPLLESIEWA